MNTTGNSRPFAACRVISVTAFRPNSAVSTSDDQRDFLQEVLEDGTLVRIGDTP